MCWASEGSCSRCYKCLFFMQYNETLYAIFSFIKHSEQHQMFACVCVVIICVLYFAAADTCLVFAYYSTTDCTIVLQYRLTCKIQHKCAVNLPQLVYLAVHILANATRLNHCNKRWPSVSELENARFFNRFWLRS